MNKSRLLHIKENGLTSEYFFDMEKISLVTLEQSSKEGMSIVTISYNYMDKWWRLTVPTISAQRIIAQYSNYLKG